MAITIIKAPDAAALARALNGLVLGKVNIFRGRDVRPNPSVAPNDLFKFPLNGKTLHFLTPAVTVTFSADLDYKGIVSEINAATTPDVAHLFKTGDNGEMALALWDDTTPVVLANDGTANPVLGFSVTASDPSLTQTPTDPTTIIEIVCEPLSRQYVAFIQG